MKKLVLKVALLLVPLVLFLGCQNSANELSDSEKESIILDVTSEFEKIITAANNHDADAMMQVHWNSQDYLYAGNGVITKGWEPMLKVVSSIHTNSKYQTYSVVLDEVMIRVIQREAAIVTALGYFHNFPTEEGPKTIQFIETCLMQKIDGKWLVTVGHESTKEDLSLL